MAIIPSNTFKTWRDGEVVKALEYMQELEILRTAINANGNDVAVLKNAALGVLKGVQNGEAFPPNPLPGDVFLRTDENKYYFLGLDATWKPLALDADLLAHMEDTDNPHSVSASQLGVYTKTETDNKFQTKAKTVVAAGQRLEVVNALFFTNGGSNNSTANVTFAEKFTQVPLVLPGSIVTPVSYMDTIGHPYIVATTTGFTVKIQTSQGNLGTLNQPKNAIMSFLVIGL
jgi:hypothetical protein